MDSGLMEWTDGLDSELKLRLDFFFFFYTEAIVVTVEC